MECSLTKSQNQPLRACRKYFTGLFDAKNIYLYFIKVEMIILYAISSKINQIS